MSRTIAIVSLLLFLTSAVFSESENGRVKPKFGEKNMGVVDRVIRLTLGAGMVGVGSYFLATESGESQNKGYIHIGIGAIPLLTGALGRCPLYYPFGIDTRKKVDASVLVGKNGGGFAMNINF